MATGFIQRFNAKIKVGSLWLGRGGFVDSASGISGVSDFCMKIALPVTAVASTDFTVTLPSGGTLLSAFVFTTVTYTGATVTIALGSSAGGAQYCTATSIVAIGAYPLTLIQPAGAGPAIMPATSPNLFIRVAQTTPTAVGLGTLILNYTAQ